MIDRITKLNDINGARPVEGLRGTVLHVFDHSFPKNDGYAFRSGEILQFLGRLGWRTIHLTSAKQGATSVSNETIGGLEFHRTQPSDRPWHRLPVLGQWSIVTTLRQTLESLICDQRPQIVHVHSPCLNGLAALPVVRRYGIPMIYEIRALWEDAAVDSGVCTEGDLRYRLSRALENHVCRKADHLITICEGLQSELADRGLDPACISIAPNSVDLDRFVRAATHDGAECTSLGLTPGKTFGFIGTFFPFEGLDVLMQAVPAILAREPAARFILVGDGPDAEKVRDLARTLRIEDAVLFVGRVPHSDILRYYDLIDILVYPRVSKRITELVTPLKPLEAMAQGKLVVASDVGGHREMVVPGVNGLLFQAGNPGSLAEICLNLLHRPQEWEALRTNGRDYVENSRSWAKNIEIYDRIYRSLLPVQPVGNQ